MFVNIFWQKLLHVTISFETVFIYADARLRNVFNLLVIPFEKNIWSQSGVCKNRLSHSIAQSRFIGLLFGLHDASIWTCWNLSYAGQNDWNSFQSIRNLWFKCVIDIYHDLKIYHRQNLS